MKAIITLSSIVCFALQLGCTRAEEEQAAMADAAPIIRALQDLLRSSPETRDGFVIVRDQASGKFVQFSGSRTEPLVLDVPTVEMTPDELARAERFFEQVSGSVRGEFSYMMTLDRDPQQGAKLAIDVFREVFDLHDLDLEAH